MKVDYYKDFISAQLHEKLCRISVLKTKENILSCYGLRLSYLMVFFLHFKAVLLISLFY